MSIGKNTQKRSLSRRQFLIGSTLAGAGIAGGALAGCAPASQGGAPASESAAASAEHEIFDLDSKSMTQGTWSWSTPPEDIPEGDIAETAECDVLVIGAGLAGCCSAIAAAEEGARVIVVEERPPTPSAVAG